MTTTLQDAIVAARAGEPERAQLLAAEVVRENPGDANGWYLLSQLVDSDARRVVYLSKTLALDPNHPRARAEFAALPPTLSGELVAPVATVATVQATGSQKKQQRRKPRGAATTAVAVEAARASAVDEPSAEIVTAEPEAITPEWVEAEVVAPAAATSADAPDWLQPLEPEAVAAVSAPQDDQFVKPAPPPPLRTYAAPRKKNGSNRALSIMLGLMVFLTLVVIAFLVYLLFF